MNVVWFVLTFLLGIICMYTFQKKVWVYLNKKIQNEKRIYQLVENSKDIIYVCDIKPDLKYRYLSPSIKTLLGENIVKDSFRNPYTAYEQIHPEDFDILHAKLNGELDYSKPIVQRWRDDNGVYKWFEEYATPIFKDGELIAIQGIIRNIDEKVKLQQDLQYQVDHDILTGIHNRDYFERLKDHYNEEENVPIAIILCDLDDLKKINDRYGHKKGDELIKVTAIFLNNFATENVIVTRIGGDEFAILIVGEEEGKIAEFCMYLEELLSKHNNDPTNMTVNLSIGYAYHSSSLSNMDQLFVKADRSMYRQKHERKEGLFVN